jgi:uncharacterized protein (UPF0332 family)
MNPHDFLEVANELVTGIREADWRSAVGRAYYAAFHVARNLFQLCGFYVPRGEQAHAYLWLRLTNSGHPDVQNAGFDLNHLRKMRNRADYDLDQLFDHVTAFGQVQIAGQIVQLLDSLSITATVRTQVTDTIKVYERDVLRQVTWRP